MTLLLARLLADSTVALSHLTAVELALAAAELGIDAAALAFIGRPRHAVEAATDLDEAA
jgi:hypothetical protein